MHGVTIIAPRCHIPLQCELPSLPWACRRRAAHGQTTMGAPHGRRLPRRPSRSADDRRAMALDAVMTA